MSISSEIRSALAERDMDVMELLKACPSASTRKKLTTYMLQLAFTGRIIRAGKREYLLSRRSGRTKVHDIRQKMTIWSIGDWPREIKPADNLPRWLSSAHG